jgi:hypothetical protein
VLFRRTAALVAGTLAFIALVATDALPWLRGPAPYPPEWQWEFRMGPTSSRPLWALLSAGALLAFIVLSNHVRLINSPRRAAAILLAGATLAGFSYQLGLLDLEPGRALPTLLSRTVSRTETSHYTVAVSEDARDPWAFIDHHAELLPKLRRTAKHAATHPPGPVLYYRALIAFCERSPSLTQAALHAAGMEIDDRRAQRPPHTPASLAAAVLGGSLLLFLCAATCWPVAALARAAAGLDALAAARIGILWTLVPGPALMSPQFDQALALPVAVAVALLVAAVRSEGSAAMARAFAAGAAAGVAFFISYGAATFVGLGALAAFALAAPGPGRLRGLVRVGALASAGGLLVLALAQALGHETLGSLRTALAIHREVYTAPRRYALWLFFNPLDLAIFLGLPVTALGLAAGVRDLRERGRPLARFRAAVAAGLALLVVSGVVRGEVGRIWIPLMPLLLVAALVEAPERPGPRDALVVGSLLAALGLTLRVFWIVP